jgi:hypothetical protein
MVVKCVRGIYVNTHRGFRAIAAYNLWSWAEDGDSMHTVIVITCSLTDLGFRVSMWNVRQYERFTK